MAKWWNITYHKAWPGVTDLFIRTRTSELFYCYLRASYHRPGRDKIMEVQRGTWRFCGYRYHWRDETIIPQIEVGPSIEHSFHLTGLHPLELYPGVPIMPVWQIWYMMFSPGGPYGREIQGPLQHQLGLEKMIGAKVYRLEDLPCEDCVPFTIPWQAAQYDDSGFFNPLANPERLTIPADGRYQVGVLLNFYIGNIADVDMYIVKNAEQAVAGISYAYDLSWGGRCYMFASMPEPFLRWDYVAVVCLFMTDTDIVLYAADHASPVFWINMV